MLKLFGIGSMGITLTGVVGYTYAYEIEPHWLSTEQLILPVLDPRAGQNQLSLVCLSDFHHESGDSLAYLDRVVQKANQLEPDLICLLGDYVFSDARTIYPLASVLSKLQAPLGVFAVLGNHDYWTDPDVVQTGLLNAGIKTFINEGLLLERGEASIYLTGLDDGWSGSPDPEKALRNAPSGIPAIMMMHEPDFADDLSEHQQIVLQLSGHSHGGQVKPLFIDAPVRPTYAHKYAAGLYGIGDMLLYVTRGIGVIPPEVRFNCRPEITRIVLTAADV